jgi:predicted enzyme related to lactoylglutathione lyase
MNGMPDNASTSTIPNIGEVRSLAPPTPALIGFHAMTAWQIWSRRCPRTSRDEVRTRVGPVGPPLWQDHGMERVLGIGGYFIRASDPAALGTWYRDCLGLDSDENGVWHHHETEITIFASFEVETDYFGSRSQQTMLNFRVRDLDAMLTQLRGKGANVADEIQDMKGIGRFGWVTDPEGNRIELWQSI